MINVFTNNAWVKPLQDNRDKTILSAFIEIVDESNRKSNKLWIDQGRKLCNKLMQGWLDNNRISMYSTHNEGKSVMSVIAERFIKTFKAKTYKKNDSQ